MAKNAMQELIEELKVNDVAHGMYWIKRPNEFFEKYLEKEKEQIIEISKNSYIAGYLDNQCKVDESMNFPEEYYNQTYNQNK
ncbi:conserved hypothetical protein [Gammaproteobacteria bacterium]